MSLRSRPLLSILGVALLAAGALTGCASGQAGPTPTGGATGSETPVEIIDVSAAWLDGGAMIGVILERSSSCRPFPDAVTHEEGVLRVSLMESGSACTTDLTPPGVAVTLPKGVDSAEDLRVEVRGAGYEGVAELPGVPDLVPGGGLEGGRPSAGWADAGTFALLTWGSSSCVPQVASAAVTGAEELVVTFVTPPADQVCTADMAPRVTVVEVPGATAGSTYEAVLAGDSFDGIRLPIAGTP